MTVNVRLQHHDRVMSKAELLEQCWPETFVSEAALTRCLTKLRKVVQAARTAPPVIKTLHDQGYRFVADVTLLPPASSSETVASPEGRDTPTSDEDGAELAWLDGDASAPPAA